MATTNETGHAKNVANYEKFIGVCVGFGAEYKPSLADLKVDSMKVQLTKAKSALKELKLAERTFGNETNNRELAFATITGLATRVIRSLESCGANELTVEDARSINNKLQGKRATPLTNQELKGEADPATEPKTRSTSQRSFDNQVDHFEKLITAVSAEPRYNPNELDLQVIHLNSILEELTIRNQLASQAENALNDARTKRNEILYADKTGICDIVTAVKSYAISAFKTSSKEYKKLTKFKFTKIQNKKK